MSNHGRPILSSFVSDDPSDLPLETQALMFDYLGAKVHSRKTEGQHGLIHGIQGKKVWAEPVLINALMKAPEIERSLATDAFYSFCRVNWHTRDLNRICFFLYTKKYTA